MKYRLAPFCSWRRDGEVIVLETPDHQLKLKPEVEDLLKKLRAGWVEENSTLQALAQYRVVVGSENRELRLLRRLDRYFESLGIAVSGVRKGSTRPETALPRKCYTFKIGSHIGHGQAAGRNLAMVKAAAEVYERLSCDARVNEELRVPNDGVIPLLNPGDFVKYSSWQLDGQDFPFGNEPSGEWALVREVSTNDAYGLPLELVCYPDRTGHKRVSSASSNGVACHTSYEAAMVGSAFELIERDALMVHWFWKLARERITPPPSLRKRVARLQKLGFECTFLNLTLETAPVVLAILQRQAQKYPRLVLGMASHASPTAAMDKALQEVELNATFCDLDVPHIEHPQDIRGVLDHQFWYDRPENHHEVLSLIGDRAIDVGSIKTGPQDVAGLEAAFSRAGFRWFTATLNPGGQAATGLYVVRSLVAGLTPIGFGYKMEPLGLERFRVPPMSVGRGQPDPSRQTAEGYKTQPFA